MGAILFFFRKPTVLITMKNFGKINGANMHGSQITLAIVRGVAILIRNSVPLVFKSIFKDPNGRFLIISVTIDNLPNILVNVYGPNNDDPNFFLNSFAEIDKFDDSNLIVGGDFNAVLGPLDYRGSQSHHSNKKSKDMINILIDEFNLIDIWRHFNPNLKQYTRHQKSPKVLSRLDFFLSQAISLVIVSIQKSSLLCHLTTRLLPVIFKSIIVQGGLGFGKWIAGFFKLIVILLIISKRKFWNLKKFMRTLLVTQIFFGMLSNALFQVIVWNIRPEKRKKEMPPSLGLWMKLVNFRLKLQVTQGTPLWVRNLLLWKLILTKLLILKQMAWLSAPDVDGLRKGRKALSTFLIWKSGRVRERKFIGWKTPMGLLILIMIVF